MKRHALVLACTTFCLLAGPTPSQAQPPGPAGEPGRSEQPGDTMSGTSGPAKAEIPTEPPRAETGAATPTAPPPTPPPRTTPTDDTRQRGAGDDDAAAAVVATTGKAGAAGKSTEVPPMEEEVKGTCKTPRQTWLQLLYWLQKDKGRWQPAEAAKCFSTAGFDHPDDVHERAAMFKETIDGRALWVRVNRLPTPAGPGLSPLLPPRPVLPGQRDRGPDPVVGHHDRQRALRHRPAARSRLTQPSHARQLTCIAPP